ncbi:sulfatase [Halocatena halophila]|uniref:sulfatase n=1 Tax=Halocatena halophila TaxID=2814576 RepID=UPI002ED28D04
MSAPDVLFCVLDSARRDRVSAYGHSRETTPTLESLASEASTFDNAYVPAPWTLPSHCSMFTGLYPSEHGVTNGFTDQRLGLPSSVNTLTERLRSDGYRTAGFSNNPWVGQLSGLDRGFEEFVEWDLEISRSNTAIHGRAGRLHSRLHTLLGHASRQPLVLLKRRFFTERLVDRAVSWIETTATDDAPTFTFLNLMEAHSPYYPPKRAFEALDLATPSAIEARRLNVKLLANIMGSSRLDRETRERLLDYYDASLRYLDSIVDRLLGAIKATGKYDETLVIFCSDHGKTLGEFDRDGLPPHYVRDINTHVPLFIKEPGQSGARIVEQPFELRQLFETVLAGGYEESLQQSQPTALVEDVIPHTGRDIDPEAVTHWRLLTDGEHKYVRSIPTTDMVTTNGENAANGHKDPETVAETTFEATNGHRQEFLFRGTGTDETVIEPESSVLDRFRTLLEERASAMEIVTEGAPADADADQLSGSIEAQLEDLGYLD